MNRRLFRMKIDRKLLLVSLVIESCQFMQNRRRLQISPRITQTLEILSCLLVNLQLIAGVQELHGSTFDATVPFEGRKWSSFSTPKLDARSTISQRRPNQSTLHRNPYRTLLQLVDMVGTPISMSLRLMTTLATSYSGQSREPLFRSNCHCKTLTLSGNRTLDHYYMMLRSP
jgi:hypothetical protein